jgi:hypothetical protein
LRRGNADCENAHPADLTQPDHAQRPTGLRVPQAM